MVLTKGEFSTTTVSLLLQFIELYKLHFIKSSLYSGTPYITKQNQLIKVFIDATPYTLVHLTIQKIWI